MADAGAALAPLSLNLALQGGGSHGALTWGVLDALLEDGRFVLDGISGTSAGAMNAVAVAHGFAQAALQHKDPALAKLDADRAKAAPMPAELREKINKLKKGA